MKYIAITAAFLLSACAPRPDAIAPVPAPPDTYAGLSCTAAASLRTDVATTLTALETRQRTAAASDAFAVFLIGVPVSGFTGSDAQDRIATEKGRLNALDARLGRCHGAHSITAR